MSKTTRKDNIQLIGRIPEDNENYEFVKNELNKGISKTALVREAVSTYRQLKKGNLVSSQELPKKLTRKFLLELMDHYDVIQKDGTKLQKDEVEEGETELEIDPDAEQLLSGNFNLD